MTFANRHGIVVHNGFLGIHSAQRLANALMVPCVGTRYLSFCTGPVLFYGVRNVSLISRRKDINNPKSCGLAMNKYASLRTMKSAGVNVPKFWSKSEMIRLLRGRDKIVFPVVARKAEHNNGSGLWVCLTKLDVRIALRKGAHHFLEFVHVHKSYRVYVYKNSVVEIIEKVPSLDATLIDLVSRNDDDGWDWNVVPPFSPLTSRVGSQALKAARSLGLDLCAIDIALDDAGRSFVFEINSASWMTQETANKYARFINEDFAED